MSSESLFVTLYWQATKNTTRAVHFSIEDGRIQMHARCHRERQNSGFVEESWLKNLSCEASQENKESLIRQLFYKCPSRGDSFSKFQASVRDLDPSSTLPFIDVLLGAVIIHTYQGNRDAWDGFLDDLLAAGIAPETLDIPGEPIGEDEYDESDEGDDEGESDEEDLDEPL